MKIFLTWLGVLLLSSAVLATVVGETDDPMVIGGGARPLGMGRAFAAVVEDADAPLINPAGGAGFHSPQVMTMFTNLLGEVYYSEYCGAFPSNFGTFGFGYVATGVNQVLVPGSSSIVYSDYHDNLLVFSYSTPLAAFFDYGQNIYVGLNAKYFNRGWTGGIYKTASGFSGDFGLKLIVSPYLSFGYNNQNFLPVDLGGVIKYESGAEEAISSIHKAGVAIRPMQLNGKLLIAADLDLPASSSRPITGHLGLEWKLTPNLMVRTGLDQSVDASTASLTSWNPTFGLSLASAGFRLDYAFHPYSNNANLATSYLSLSYQWAPWSALKGEAQ
ncbi:MAG: hypothetical protein PHH14_01320 [Candidatus Margulisbacteria bacterium]|nr:hypothetical protein [Candidatus Margulisiibacteriota bacterium]